MEPLKYIDAYTHWIYESGPLWVGFSIGIFLRLLTSQRGCEICNTKRTKIQKIKRTPINQRENNKQSNRTWAKEVNSLFTEKETQKPREACKHADIASTRGTENFPSKNAFVSLRRGGYLPLSWKKTWPTY